MKTKRYRRHQAQGLIIGIARTARRNKNAEEGVYLKLKKAKLKQLR